MNPLDFIPVVEETQLINPMTEWVLQNSLGMIKEFQRHGIDTAVSINISAKNLQHPRFFDRMTKIIAAYDVAWNLIEFEMTESALMHDPERIRDLLQQFRNRQIMLSIDDFGTGYSSLAYLSRFPIDAVKIDRYFVQQMLRDEGVRYIVAATINLAHQLGLTVVAEGVEDYETECRLTEMRCDLAQGYYYARPLNSADILSWYADTLCGGQ